LGLPKKEFYYYHLRVSGFSGAEPSLRTKFYYSGAMANRNARSGSRLIQNPPLSGNKTLIQSSFHSNANDSHLKESQRALSFTFKPIFTAQKSAFQY